MKNELIREFIRRTKTEEPMFLNDNVAMVPREYAGLNRQIGCEHSLIFNIVQRKGEYVAGEIALRIGDSPEQFYLGHIGYHVDPPFRGYAYATQACLLCVPALTSFGMRFAVITTDPTNLPSVKTCLNLGCELECTVDVPEKITNKLEISAVKRRYIWTLYDR
jgi:predicted acetyltransferase